jgi:uncharacterized protein (DUF2345 family)
MSPEPGTEVTLVPPIAPGEAVAADEAAAGAVEETQREAATKEKASLALTKVKPHKPPETQEEKEEKTAWIEISLVDDDDQPVPGARYRVTLPDGSVDEGTLDAEGFARVEGFEPGQCKVSFPEMDERDWKAK